MPELSNSIRQRLGSRPAPATHPDADILTAYAEQLLPAGERNQITEHLAACSFCREVVYLSLPAVPELTTVHTLPVSSRFWKFGYRWAGAVAVLAIAAVLVIPRLPHKQPVQGNAVTPQGSPAPVTQASVSKTLDSTPAADQSRDLPTVPSNTRSESLSANNRTRGAEVISRGNGNVQSPPPVPIRVASEAAAPETAKDGVISSGPTPSVASILAASNQAKPVAPQGKEFKNNNFYIAEERTRSLISPDSYQYARQEQAKAEADRQKKQSTLTVAQNSDQDTASHKKSFLRSALPIGPIVSVMGTLKSAAAGASTASETMASDKGNSLAAAPVRPAISTKAVTSTAAGVSHEAPEAKRKVAGSDQLHWRIQDGKLVNSADLNQWHEAYPGQGDEIQFKVVQAQGHEVWAGGTNTTLVHSWNGGVDWQKLNLGDAASGDIEKISLSGADVLVKTSNGQHLISRDGGKTWSPMNGDSTQPK
jgi:hypothetical protein